MHVKSDKKHAPKSYNFCIKTVYFARSFDRGAGCICDHFSGVFVFSGDTMRQITTRLSTPEPLEARLALDATFSQLYLQPAGNQFEAGHTIAELVHANTTISQGAQYYSIDGTSVRDDTVRC